MLLTFVFLFLLVVVCCVTLSLWWEQQQRRVEGSSSPPSYPCFCRTPSSTDQAFGAGGVGVLTVGGAVVFAALVVCLIGFAATAVYVASAGAVSLPFLPLLAVLVTLFAAWGRFLLLEVPSDLSGLNDLSGSLFSRRQPCGRHLPHLSQDSLGEILTRRLGEWHRRPDRRVRGAELTTLFLSLWWRE